VTGALNGTAPNPVTNKAFSKALGRALHRPAIFPTPGFMLRLMLGEVASVVTTGQKVIPRRTLDSGYDYKFTDLDLALQDIVGK
jgi:NAD dependent epimerase/dehydratase family enzyme